MQSLQCTCLEKLKLLFPSDVLKTLVSRRCLLAFSIVCSVSLCFYDAFIILVAFMCHGLISQWSSLLSMCNL